MKKIIFLLGILSFAGCASHKNIVQDSENVNQVLDDWHQAAADANFNAYFEKMDENSVFVGTDASEVWTKTAFQKFAKPYFDKGKAWRFKSKQRHLHFDHEQKTAWFDELLDTWMGECRGSGVLIKKNGKWLIKHYVLSMTIPNKKINSVIHAIKEERKNE